jgi:hypothetical protein
MPDERGLKTQDYRDGWRDAMSKRTRDSFATRLSDGLAVLYPNGAVLYDSSFKTEDDAFELALGWPHPEEVEAAKKRGMRVVRVVVLEAGHETS